MLKPSQVHLHKQSKTLELTFGDSNYHLPAEYLRVHSPSSEVRGHGPGQEVLVHGKINVGIENIKATGNYGLTIIFDDGHNSGIFSWPYLQKLAKEQDTLWQSYLAKLKTENKNRDPHTNVLHFSP